MEEENEIQTSKFNSAEAKEKRRNLLWTDANNHSRLGYYQKWNEDLDCVWSELAADIKEKEFEEKKKEFDEFDNRLGNFSDIKSDDFSSPTKERIDARNKNYKILRDKEIFLRKLENHLGKGTKWEDNDRDFM